MSYILDEPFFDLTNDIVIGSATKNTYTTLFKNSYPDMLFLGPFTEDDRDFNMHIHVDFFRKKWQLNSLEEVKVYYFNNSYGNSGNIYLNKELFNSKGCYALAYPNYLRPRLDYFNKNLKDLTIAGELSEEMLQVPKPFQETLAKVTLEKLSNLPVNTFSFLRKCHQSDIDMFRPNVETTLYDFYKGCVYDKLTEKSDPRSMNIRELNQDLFNTFICMYLLGFELDITAVNRVTNKIDFLRYDEYLMDDPTDFPPFFTSLPNKIRSSGGKLAKSYETVNEILNGIMRSNYGTALEFILNFNFKTGVPDYDELFYYRIGVLIGLIEKYHDQNNVKNIKPPENDGYFRIDYVEYMNVNQYPYGNALVKSSNFVNVPKVYLDDPIFNKTENGFVYNESFPLESYSLNGYRVSELLDLLEASIEAGSIQDTIYIAMELYRYIVLEKFDIVDMMYQRLLKTCLFKVTALGLNFHAYMINWVQKWVLFGDDENSRFQADQIYMGIDPKYHPLRLILTIQILVNISKSNVQTYLMEYEGDFEKTRAEVEYCENYQGSFSPGYFSSLTNYVQDSNRYECLLDKYMNENNVRVLRVVHEMLKDEGRKNVVDEFLSKYVDPDILKIMLEYNEETGDNVVYYVMLLNIIRGTKESLDLQKIENLLFSFYAPDVYTPDLINLLISGLYTYNTDNIEAIMAEHTISNLDTISQDEDIVELISRLKSGNPDEPEETEETETEETDETSFWI